MNYKFAIIGSSAIGKTSWVNKMVNDIYTEEYIPSTTSESYQINYKNNLLTCIDVPSTMIDTFIDNQLDDINGVFLMCDSSGSNMNDIEKWQQKINIYKNIKSVLVINKLDIDGEFVPESFCKINNINSFIAISILLEFQIFDPIDKMLILLNHVESDKNIKKSEVNIHLFVRKLMEMTYQCNNEIYLFKIGYLKLSHKELFLINDNVMTLIQKINDILLSIAKVEEVLNFLIKYEY